jgi:hypothetical protein
MKSVIVRHGSIAGLVIGIPMIVYSLSLPADASLPSNMTVITYAVMLVALSMVFVGIKQYRDRRWAASSSSGQHCCWAWASAPWPDSSTRCRGRSAWPS